MMNLVQGRKGIFYCGNYASPGGLIAWRPGFRLLAHPLSTCLPGNGHDLSFLGGVVIACAIGADYPFEGDAPARRDFVDMRKFMGM